MWSWCTPAMTFALRPATASAVLNAAVRPTASSAECTRKRDPLHRAVIRKAGALGIGNRQHERDALRLANHRDDVEVGRQALAGGQREHVAARVKLGVKRGEQDREVALAAGQRLRQRSGPCCFKNRWNSEAIASPEGSSPGPSGGVSWPAASSRRSTNACTSGSDWTARETWRS